MLEPSPVTKDDTGATLDRVSFDPTAGALALTIRTKGGGSRVVHLTASTALLRELKTALTEYHAHLDDVRTNEAEQRRVR